MQQRNGSHNMTGVKSRPARLLLRAALALDGSMLRCNRMVGIVYTVIIASLQLIMCYIYVAKLHALVHAAFAPAVAWLHTALSAYFLTSVVANFARCHATPPSYPPPPSRHAGGDADVDADVEAGTRDCSGGGEETGAPAAELMTEAVALPLPLPPPPTPMTKSETWRVCGECQAAKPPRTHHCKMCNACYARMCHHCPALGRCVARDNYPFFFRFVTSTAVGCAFAAATCRQLLAHHHQHALALDVDNHAAAHVGAGGGGGSFDLAGGGEDAGQYRDEREEFLFALMLGGCTLALSTGLLAIGHVYLTCSAQTTVELLENWQVRRHGAAPARWGWFGGPFTGSVRANVVDSLGRPGAAWMPWWSVLLLPYGRGDVQK